MFVRFKIKFLIFYYAIFYLSYSIKFKIKKISPERMQLA